MNKSDKKILKLGDYCPECLSNINFKETGYQKTIKVDLCQHMGGLVWKFTGENHHLSIICHSGSYGRESGLFEVYPSWEEDVTGYLTFGQVQNWIKRLERREAKENE